MRKGIAFPLLSDHDSQVIRAWGLADRRYRRNSQLDVDSSGGVPVYGLAYPSVFVLNSAGKIGWRFVSEHEELRFTAADILDHSLGQMVEQSRTPMDAGKVHVDITASDEIVGLGTRLIIGLELRIPPGLHIYGPEVGGDYRGMVWRMDETDCSIPGEVNYPRPLMLHPAFADGKLPVYEGAVRVERELIVKPMISISTPDVLERFSKSCLDANSKFAVSGSLEFQACSDRECFPPESAPVKWRFDFTGPDRVRVPVEDWRIFEQP